MPFLFLIGALQAAPVGNVYQPSILEEGFFIPDTCWGNFRLGFQSDYVPKKRLEVPGLSPIQQFKIRSIAESGSITVNIKERLDLYAFLGSGKGKISFVYRNHLFSGESPMRFTWNSGAKLVLLEIKDTGIGVDVKYQGTWFPIQFEAPIGSTQINMNEWQISGGISQKVGFFIPYFGVSVCYCNLYLKPQTFPQLHLKHEDLVGIFFGFSLSSGSYFLANFEGRLINENAFTATAEFRF